MMKTEIDNLIKALEAFKAKLADQEHPVAEEDWVYLYDPTHVLRKGIDQCRLSYSEEWAVVDGLAGRTIEYARGVGYDMFMCLRKDSPHPCHHEPEVKQVEPGETFPQYWTTTSVSGLTKFVRRDSPTITVSVDPQGRETKWAGKWHPSEETGRTRLTEQEALAMLKPVDPEKELLAKAQDNAGDGVEVDSYHRLGWYRMACGGIARIKRTYDEIACSIIIGDVVEAGSTFTDQVWSKTTGTHETNSDWNLIRWKGIEQ